ncbi:GNAT family N-acetyltransferase [Bacillus sp. NPDC094106]|uniref:GNAT family N-acetyltransferase n=1 Tax=Bacillus sp. NPDC094106 TaxID=3363949 RepID=UPI0038280533
MDLKYFIFDTIPDANLMDSILNLHNKIFGSNDNLIIKMKDKPKLLFNIALDGKKVVGFKIGYEFDKNKFYSWLGGVDTNYRNHGIASELMEQQHQYLKEHGYKIVQTKTMNRWRSMLILNIKNGFDVMDIYTDNKGLHKIILEKNLCN